MNISKGITAKILPAVITAALLVVGLSYYFYLTREEARPADIIKEKQKRQLEVLREQAEPIGKDELERQKKELEQFRKGIKPLTEEEINKQKEELNKLRNGE